MGEKTGTVGWVDLTVEDAPRLRDFYESVVGWRVEEVDMGGYADYNMAAPVSGTPTAGVCHARGVNAGLPPVWMVYFIVDDLDASIARVVEKGGDVIAGPRGMGGASRYAVVRDPVGAVCALYQEG